MKDVKGVVTLESNDKIEGITDDKFFYTQDDLETVRRHLGMYISKDQTAGAVHLFKELLANSIDETNNKNPHWDKNKKEITVVYYESERKIIVMDNGRGIPADILVSVVMKKHASTKTIGLSEARNKKVTGLNGIGMTVCAALSDYMYIITYRGNQSKKIELIDGELKEHTIQKTKEYRTGTEVGIIPSEKYLGPINLTTDIIEDYIRNMSYIIEPDVTITFIGEKNPDEKNPKKRKFFTHIYEAQGLGSATKYMSSSLEFPPVEAKFVSDEYDISIAFSYDRTLDDSVVASFCNYVITTEGGCHETIATRAICDYFSKEAKRQEPNAKYEVAFDDCKRGLVLAVNLEHITPKFEGQHKTRVSNNDIINDAKKGLYDVIYKIMNNNPQLMKKIVAYLRQIAKARHESHKIRGVSVKKTTTFLEDAEIEKYFTVSNRNSTGYKELFLAEGDSAAGSILNSRNPLYQAVYTVQGVTDNVHDLSLTQLLQKKMFNELITILGTGIGKNFDITKLRYDKIIICSDSDVDGHNITSLLLCFFFIFMPDLIREGKLYKAMPPLYLMDLKSLRRYYNGREWLYDKIEYYNMVNTIIADNCEFALEVPNQTSKKSKQPEVYPMSKKDAIKWLNMNSEYKLELDNLGKKAACDPRILETVCYLKVNSKSPADFKKRLEEAYPEMTYDSTAYSLIGSWEGNFFSLICDGLFDKSASRFIEEMKKNPSLYVWYRNKKNSNDKFKRATIGEFLADMDQTFNIKIDQRFKGLGEADADLLFRTTTNPKYRKLLKIDIHDFDKTTDVFELLHGKSPKLREARRELIDNTRLSYADIDN